MGKLLAVFMGILVIVVVGGGVFLAGWDIPAPTHDVEKLMDDSQFPR